MALRKKRRKKRKIKFVGIRRLIFLHLIIATAAMMFLFVYVSDRADEYYHKAKSFLIQRDADNAIYYLKKSITFGRRRADSYALLGTLYKIDGQNKRAEKNLTLAIKMFKKNLKRYELKGDAEMTKSTLELIKEAQKRLSGLSQ